MVDAVVGAIEATEGVKGVVNAVKAGNAGKAVNGAGTASLSMNTTYCEFNDPEHFVEYYTT